MLGRGVAFWKQLRQLPADHHRDQPIAVHVLHGIRADHPAVTQDRHFAGDSEHFADAVRDVDDGAPAGLEVRHDPEELIHLALRERRGGLVHDQDVGLVGDGARNLDHLLAGNRQVGDPLVRIDVDLQTSKKLACAPAERAMIDKPDPGQRLAADPDVLGHRHRRHQVQFLVDPRGAPANGDTAGVRAVHAGDDLHERRFARAVFPYERVHRARLHAHRHAVQRDHAWKDLSHLLHFEQIRHEARIH